MTRKTVTTKEVRGSTGHAGPRITLIKTLVGPTRHVAIPETMLNRNYQFWNIKFGFC